MRLPIAVFVTIPLLAQAPRFEVASIRLNQETEAPSVLPGLRNGRLTAQRATLRRILARAYGLTEPQILGPAWLETNRFDIVAKAPVGVPDTQLKPMLQVLLAERFKLKAHLETRVQPGFRLVVAPGGVKMPVYPAPNPLAVDPKNGGFPMAMGRGAPAVIADILSSLLGKAVIDQTGLTEQYNFVLSFAPLSAHEESASAEFRPPDIFTAVQRQLGLKLEADKVEVPVLVVEHIEKTPTDN